MKMLEQLLSQGRTAARRARARLPGEARALRPVRLALRLNDQGVPDGWCRAAGDPLDLAGWRALLVGFTHWLGPLRVSFSGGAPLESRQLDELVRFANRLECPTHLICDGEGLDPERASGLVGRGLAAITVRLPEPGGDPAAAFAAVDAIRGARDDWGRPLVIYAAVPLSYAPAEAAALADRARTMGTEGVVGCLALGAPPPAGAEATRAALGEGDHTPRHLLDAVRAKRHPLPGGPRAGLLADGTLEVSPLGPAAGVVDPKDVAGAWELATTALDAARGMARPWDELELAPELLLSKR
jgi:hypothetical protein